MVNYPYSQKSWLLDIHIQDLLTGEELVQWVAPCLEAQEADPLKGIFRGREGFDFSACRVREWKGFGWLLLPFKTKSGNSNRMQCRNVVPVKSRICLLPDSWEGVSFSTQASLCKDTWIELGEGSLRRTWQYPQEFRSVTNRCLFLVREGVAEWNRHVWRQGQVVNCRSTLDVTKMLWAFEPQRGSCLQVLSCKER